MAIVQISKIINRTGSYGDLPQLSAGEIGFATDHRRVFIGNDLTLYPPSLGNNRTSQTELLTEHSQISFSQLSSSGDTELYINAPENGQVLAYDKSKNAWVNAGVQSTTQIHLGSANNVKVGGGLPGYVLETDGAGNLNWTPKDVHISRITDISTTSPIVIETEQSHGLVDRMNTTILDVVGMAYGANSIGNISASSVSKIVTGSGFNTTGEWNGKSVINENGVQIGVVSGVNSTSQLTLIDYAVIEKSTYYYSLPGAGTISVAQGSTQVSGNSSTNFLSINEGALILTSTGALIGVVDYVESSNTLYLVDTYTANDLSNIAYHYTKLGDGVISASVSSTTLNGRNTSFRTQLKVGSYIWSAGYADNRYIGKIGSISTSNDTTATLTSVAYVDYGLYSDAASIAIGMTFGDGTISMFSDRTTVRLSGAEFVASDIGKVIVDADGSPIGMIKSVSVDGASANLYKPATVQSATYKFTKIATGTITTSTSGVDAKIVYGTGTAFGYEVLKNDVLTTADGTVIGVVDTVISNVELALVSESNVALNSVVYCKLEAGNGYIYTEPSSTLETNASIIKTVYGSDTTFISSGIKSGTLIFTHDNLYVGTVAVVTNQYILSLVEEPMVRGIGVIDDQPYKIGNSINGTSAYVKVIDSTHIELYSDLLFSVPFNAEFFSEYVSGGLLHTTTSAIRDHLAPGGNGMVMFNKNGMMFAAQSLMFKQENETNPAELTITGGITASNVTVSGLVRAVNLQGTLNTQSSSQPNVTSIGTLTALSVSGNASILGNAAISTLSVANNISTSTLTTSGNTSIGGNLSVTGPFTSNGISTFEKLIYANKGFESISLPNITTRIPSGLYEAAGNKAGYPNNNENYNVLVLTNKNTDNNYSLQIAGEFSGDGVFIRNTGNVTDPQWNKLWHSGNDGSGSGLDADTLDGYNSSYFKNSYTAIVRRSTWSRIAKFSAPANTEQYYGSAQVTLKHTRYNVVVGGVLLVSFGHSNNGQLVLLGSHGYSTTQVKIRLVVADNDSSVYMEVWDENASDLTDDNAYTIILDNINCNPTTYTTFVSGNVYNPNVLSELTTENNQIIIDGYKVWHSGNDGSSSGLDADTLDGYHASIASSANAVVVRNSDGSIDVGSLKTSNDDISSISGALAFRTSNTDNVLKFCNDTNEIRKYLGVNEVRFTKTVNTTQNKWYRIASSAVGIGRNGGEFIINWSVSESHGRVKFSAGCHYGLENGVDITQHHYSRYTHSENNGIVAVRVLSKSDYYNNRYAYVDVQYSSSMLNVKFDVELLDGIGWTLDASIPEINTIPDGYYEKVHTFVNAIVDIGTTATYPVVTINSEGRIISGRSLASSDLPQDIIITSLSSNVLTVNNSASIGGDISIGGNVAISGILSSSSGNTGTDSSPNRVWGSMSSDDHTFKTYLTSALSVNRAVTAGKLEIAEIGASVDLNSIITTGLYSQSGNNDAISGSNYPVDFAGILEVFAYSHMVHQRYWVYNSSDIYVRSIYTYNVGHQWTEWIKHANVDDSITGNSSTATKLANARTISLAGGVTGSVSFDGSANASITTTVDGTKHSHNTATSVNAGFMSANDKTTLDNIANKYVPAGATMYFARSTPPNGWLVANGSIVNRNDFPQLFDAIGTTFNIGATSETEYTFRLPDLRKRFIYGWDAFDNNRAFGSYKKASKHFHGIGHASFNNNDDMVLVVREWSLPESPNYNDAWPNYETTIYPGRVITGDAGYAGIRTVATQKVLQRDHVATTNAFYVNHDVETDSPLYNKPYVDDSTDVSEHGNPPNIALLPCIKY